MHFICKNVLTWQMCLKKKYTERRQKNKYMNITLQKKKRFDIANSLQQTQHALINKLSK